MKWAVGIGLLLCLLGGYLAGRQQGAQVAALARSALQDSLAHAQADTGRRFVRVADSGHAVADRQHRKATQPRPVHMSPSLPDTTAQDSARYWQGVAGVRGDSLVDALQSLDSLEGAYQSLAGAFVAQKAATGRMTVAYEGQRDRADQLAVALQKQGCRKIPLLGISLPKVGIGYGATLTNGVVRTGPVVAVVIPLGGCRA